MTIADYRLTAYNLGGVLGAPACATAIARNGSRVPLLLCCIGGAASAWLILGVDLKHQTTLLILGLGLHGLFVNAVQSTMYALCAYVYSTGVRATAAASALAFGRLGAILSAFAGAAVITVTGGAGYLLMLGSAMMGVFVALTVVRQHIPADSTRRQAIRASGDRRDGDDCRKREPPHNALALGVGKKPNPVMAIALPNALTVRLQHSQFAGRERVAGDDEPAIHSLPERQ